LRENFKCRLGDFSVITGTPGFGKTTFANDLFCGIALRQPPDHRLGLVRARAAARPRRNLRSWFCRPAEYTARPGQLDAADRWIDASTCS
jgi:twinkle protein